MHHIDSSIPHYRAQAATKALQDKWPELYLHEPSPIWQALWRVATKCFTVQKRKNASTEDLYVFVDK
jgi:fatty acid desaturase